MVGPYFQPKLEGEGKKRVYDLFLTVISGTTEAISPQNSVPAEMIVGFMLDYFKDSGTLRTVLE